MEHISVFDMFKIGIGPSSSHTLGPWRAAQAWIKEIKHELHLVKNIKVKLYGSLSLTGKGHGTDMAIILALYGESPEDIIIEDIPKILAEVMDTISIESHIINFNPKEDIIFSEEFLPFHSNGICFTAIFECGKQVESVCYSIGGGFIVKENEVIDDKIEAEIPYIVKSAYDLSRYCKNHAIWEIALKNELALSSQKEISEKLQNIWRVMEESIHLGCHTSGILPGGLCVKRRAFDLHARFMEDESYSSIKEWRDCITKQNPDFREIFLWVGLFALAVNEVNAALGRIVTSPTNGSSGVIPAVLMYYLSFIKKEHDPHTIEKFLLTAGIIGSLFKRNATISAAAGGCQAEIGVSSAMAAAGLAEALGGSPEQVMIAAEIAMEHHLGMTCDPIGGLVQIPCIERNSMGATKAILAAELALQTDPSQTIVSLDNVIDVMWETAQNMDDKYKETSTGGLAIKVSVRCPEC